MGVDELLKAVNDLSASDLDHLVDRSLFLRARRKANVLTSDETALLLEINQGIPTALHDRYEALLEKRDDETLTDPEYAELLDISNQIEAFGTQLIDALAKLATLRQVPLIKLMDDLGIQSPGVRSD
jgi:hypothetical protein